jgi:Aldehyde dehydrogenase family
VSGVRVPPPLLHREHDLGAALAELEAAAPRLAETDAVTRAELARECIGALADAGEPWAAAAAAAKGLPDASPWLGEELVSGPAAVARLLQLVAGALDDIARDGAPRLPGPLRTDADGRLRAPVLPVGRLQDGVAFRGFSGEVVLAEGVTEETRFAGLGRGGRGLALVLGAGNITSIGIADTLERVLLHGTATALKLHPRFAPLEPHVARALSPLLRRGFVRLLTGGAELGAAAVRDPRVSLVHMTGSASTFQNVVRTRREASGGAAGGEPGPLRFVAELGNVTPWIVVPGEWSAKELRFQAQNLAGSILSNASFNCICPKVVVTSRAWPQREEFLETLRALLASAPPRPAFYPGAAERFLELVGEPAGAPAGHLPWTLLRDADPDSRPELFEHENFLCVSAETSLDEADPARFIDASTGFADDRLAGTLAATIVVHPRQRAAGPVRHALERAIARMRYGTVCINQFAGLAFILMSTPWGGAPGATLDDPKSGIGFSHNPFMLEGVEKTVLEGPFRISPTPMWLPANRNPVGIARALLALYLRPSPARLPGLLVQALRG